MSTVSSAVQEIEAVPSVHDHHVRVYPPDGDSAVYAAHADYEDRGARHSVTVYGRPDSVSHSEALGGALRHPRHVVAAVDVGGAVLSVHVPPAIARLLAEHLRAAADVADGITA